ncbi:bifunctional DNA primase/polymerase (plasmid) [Streptomyces sp. NBC_01717]|uniref:bifunctional DNA primase/polymerase n=1 Tax=Streptomyces sp. NBC_01717 TaxID=2975918 RepID=UPI002E373347|nr:bifunctional DNA primase/polymerase [Streptomyces sp. NBC_01717]
MPVELRFSRGDSRCSALDSSVAEIPLATAHWYAGSGWPVHPLTPGRRTPPRNCIGYRGSEHTHGNCTCLRVGRRCHSFHAALGRRRISRWWGHCCQFGGRVAGGPANLAVVDLDARRACQAVLVAGAGRDLSCRVLASVLASVEACGWISEGAGFSRVLNRAAYALGGLVVARRLMEDEAWSDLLSAAVGARPGQGRGIEQFIRSGLASALQRPLHSGSHP